MDSKKIEVLAISGSLRPASTNSGLLKAIEVSADSGVQLNVYGGYAGIPAFDESLEAGPEPVDVARLRAAIRAADALLIATPEYNGSVPGGLKNAIDWASRPYGRSAFSGKPALVIGASVSPNGAKWAQADLRRILQVAGADVIDSELAVGPSGELFDESGRLTDPATQDALRQRLELLTSRVPVPAAV